MSAEETQCWADTAVSEVPCCKCGGPVIEFSIPNEAWNLIVRMGGRETDQEYLCIACFAQKCVAFSKAVMYIPECVSPPLVPTRSVKTTFHRMSDQQLNDLAEKVRRA